MKIRICGMGEDVMKLGIFAWLVVFALSAVFGVSGVIDCYGGTPRLREQTVIEGDRMAEARRLASGAIDGGDEEEIAYFRDGMRIVRWDGKDFVATSQKNDVPIIEDMAVGDMDNDGRPEIVCAVLNGLLVAKIVNSTLTVSSVEIPLGLIENVAIGDLDGDGKNEIALSAQIDVKGASMEVDAVVESIHVLKYNAGKATEICKSEPHNWVQDMTVIDVDGDGRNELAVAELVPVDTLHRPMYVNFYRLGSGGLTKDAALALMHDRNGGESPYPYLAKRRVGSREELLVSDESYVQQYDAESRRLSKPIITLPTGDRILAIYTCDYDGSGSQSVFLNVYSTKTQPLAVDAQVSTGTQTLVPGGEAKKSVSPYRTLILK